MRYARPEDYDLLAKFYCGSDEPWEEEINEYFQGLGRNRGDKDVQVRVAIDPGEGKLVAAGAFRDDIELVAMPSRRKEETATYIRALGITSEYRENPGEEWKVGDYTSIGDLVLNDLLRAIREHWDGRECVVWAHIATKNKQCQGLVEKVGFTQMMPLDNGYDVWGARLLAKSRFLQSLP
jgi:hypothetical protein